MRSSEKKARLRKRLLAKRENLSETDYHQWSECIIKRLRDQREFKNAHVIHCYASMADRREVDTVSLIKQMLKENKQVVVPVTNFETGSLEHFTLNNFKDLKPNKWGVPEPDDGIGVDPSELDLVIVPMVGGDQNGNRLGYGKGFYDQFLKELSCKSIGLCFETCIIDSIPVEEFDVRLSKIITEKRVI